MQVIHPGKEKASMMLAQQKPESLGFRQSSTSKPGNLGASHLTRLSLGSLI